MDTNESNYIVEKPIGISILFGIIIGWILSFILICLISGDSIDNIFKEDEFRFILFISFPMGAILGTTFVLVSRKVAKDKEENKQTVAPIVQKDTVTKLKELKELLDSGVITQEEFNSQKEKLLAEY